MKPVTLSLSVISITKVSQLLTVVSAAAAKSPFTEQFFQRYQFLVATGDLLVQATGVNYSNRVSAAGEIRACIEPTDGFRCLCTAFLAGDGDFSYFDSEYSFSQSVETKQ